MADYRDLARFLTFAPLQSPLAGDMRSSPFRAPWPKTVRLLGHELHALGAGHVVMEVDMAAANIRQDGMPRADRHARTPGIVLSFVAYDVPRRAGSGPPSLRYEVAEFAHWTDNVRAIALGLEALRAVDRYGVTKLGEQYQGWAQLTAGGAGDGDAVHGRELIAAAGGNWRRAAALSHPDVNPDAGADDFRDVIAARDADGL